MNNRLALLVDEIFICKYVLYSGWQTERNISWWFKHRTARPDTTHLHTYRHKHHPFNGKQLCQNFRWFISMSNAPLTHYSHLTSVSAVTHSSLNSPVGLCHELCSCLYAYRLTVRIIKSQHYMQTSSEFMKSNWTENCWRIFWFVWNSSPRHTTSPPVSNFTLPFRYQFNS